jgi:hypothetical protein
MTMMKKLSFVGAALVAMSVAGFAFAGVDDVTITTGAVVTNGGTHAGTAAYVVRGEILAVVVTSTTGSTNTVTLTSADGQTIFSRAACTSGTATYPIVTPVFVASTGAALTDTMYAYNSATNVAYTVARYGGIPCASKVTLSVIGAGGPQTNTVSTKIIFRN